MLFVAGLADFFSCTRRIRSVFCRGIGKFFFSCTRLIRNVFRRGIGRFFLAAPGVFVMFFVAALAGFF
jgi:hypothetical protein